jgi:hypothetical protein
LSNACEEEGACQEGGEGREEEVATPAGRHGCLPFVFPRPRTPAAALFHLRGVIDMAAKKGAKKATAKTAKKK